jgi:hypothetical protein
MKNKKAFQMSFAWMFAIIVGVAIIFLAIYAASQFIKTSEREVTTKTAKAILNALDKVQTTVEDASSDTIELNIDTRIFTSCNTNGNFGNSIIEISEKINFADDWSTKGGDVSTQNAYLFAEDMIQGKQINFLIFPFRMPYKVADVTVAYKEPYCFVNAPRKVENVISSLASSKQNLIITNNLGSCPGGSKSVCFNIGSCDVNVNCEGDCKTGIINKKEWGSGEYFTGNLLYGAIFSSEENYKCNSERLAMRLSELSDVYQKKAQFVSSKGCNTGLREEVFNLKSLADNYEDPSDFVIIENVAKDIDDKNEVLECQLY